MSEFKVIHKLVGIYSEFDKKWKECCFTAVRLYHADIQLKVLC